MEFQERHQEHVDEAQDHKSRLQSMVVYRLEEELEGIGIGPSPLFGAVVLRT